MHDGARSTLLKLIVMSSCIVISCIVPVTALSLTLYTHSLQGQTYIEDGELRGKKAGGKRSFNLELVREMMNRLKVKHTISEVPFKRGLLKIKTGKEIAFFNVSRTPTREPDMKWVGPLQIETDYLYKMKGTPLTIQTLEDARKVDSICVLNGGIHEEVLQKHNFGNLRVNNSYVSCFLMLKSGRVQLTPSASSTVKQKLIKAEIPETDIVQTPVVIATSGGYLVFSNDVADAVIEQWQKVLDDMKKDGTYDRLLRLYFH